MRTSPQDERSHWHCPQDEKSHWQKPHLGQQSEKLHCLPLGVAQPKQGARLRCSWRTMMPQRWPREGFVAVLSLAPERAVLSLAPEEAVLSLAPDSTAAVPPRAIVLLVVGEVAQPAHLPP
jgi:hypothetical protein